MRWLTASNNGEGRKMNAQDELFRKELIKEGLYGLNILIRQSTGRYNAWDLGNPVIQTIWQYLNLESDEDRRDYYNYAFTEELFKSQIISRDIADILWGYLKPRREKHGHIWHGGAKYLIMDFSEDDPEEIWEFIEKVGKEEGLDFSILDRRYKKFKMFINQLGKCLLFCGFRKKCLESLREKNQ